jgi:hypothetical protein
MKKSLELLEQLEEYYEEYYGTMLCIRLFSDKSGGVYIPLDIPTEILSFESIRDLNTQLKALIKEKAEKKLSTNIKNYGQ